MCSNFEYSQADKMGESYERFAFEKVFELLITVYFLKLILNKQFKKSILLFVLKKEHN